MNRTFRWTLLALDAALIALMTLLAYYARFEGAVPTFFERWIPALTIVSAPAYLLLFALFGLYRLVFRYVGIDVLLRLVAAVGLGLALLTGVNMLMPLEQDMRPIPMGVLFIQAVLVFVTTAGVRLGLRIVLHLHSLRQQDKERVLIVGAGSAGHLLLREIKARPDLGMSVAGFLDDDPSLLGRTIDGTPVLGSTKELATTVSSHRAEEVIVAMPSAPKETVRRILNAAADAGVKTRVMPSLFASKGSVGLDDLQNVDVEDLLGREPTPIDVDRIRDTVTGKIVAVTGAAGTIGSELCRQLALLSPEKLILIDIDETRLYELFLQTEHSHPGLARIAICDIKERRGLDAVLSRYKPAIVLHSAAYKHVPLMELAPAEAIKTNVAGTRNVIAACEQHGVKRLVLISTDKAVAPVNMMGMSKAIAELIALQAAKRQTLEIMIVRFGNVLASRGSVIPIFKEQLRRGGPLTVTHEDVTRYFMTAAEAARLTLQAQAIGASGDTLMLEMGEPMRISDLAKRMIALSGTTAEIVFTGLRPGEKLHEALVGERESLVATGVKGILKVEKSKPQGRGLSEKIDELIAAGEANDVQRIDAIIDAIDPGYRERAT